MARAGLMVDRPRPGGRHQLTGDLTPIRKVGAGALSGALATVALWLISLTNVEVPATVAAAITLVITAGVAYLVPSEESR